MKQTPLMDGWERLALRYLLREIVRTEGTHEEAREEVEVLAIHAAQRQASKLSLEDLAALVAEDPHLLAKVPEMAWVNELPWYEHSAAPILVAVVHYELEDRLRDAIYKREE